MGLDPRLRVVGSAFFSAANFARLLALGLIGPAAVAATVSVAAIAADQISRERTGKGLLERAIIPEKFPDTGVGISLIQLQKDIINFINFGAIR